MCDNNNILQSDKDQSDFKLAMKTKMGQNPQIIVSLKSDNQSKMLLINKIHDLLKDPDVNALRLSYSALRKSE